MHFSGLTLPMRGGRGELPGHREVCRKLSGTEHQAHVMSRAGTCRDVLSEPTVLFNRGCTGDDSDSGHPEVGLFRTREGLGRLSRSSVLAGRRHWQVSHGTSENKQCAAVTNLKIDLLRALHGDHEMDLTCLPWEGESGTTAKSDAWGHNCVSRCQQPPSL